MNSDRRAHARLSLTLNIAEPMGLEIRSGHETEKLPAVIVNISAGGLSLLLFKDLDIGTVIETSLDFMGVQEEISGKIVRIEERMSATYIAGVQFNSPVEVLDGLIENMAEDTEICDIRYLLYKDEACFADCSFRVLCAKRIKKDF